VNRYLEILIASLATFAATNIDDAFLLTFFFARLIPAWRTVAGQYIGFAIIVAVSLIGAMASLAIPHHWIRLIGLLPLALGITHLFTRRRKAEGQSTGEFGVVAIALITMSNGADNIGVYVPFFVVMGRANLWLILIVYAVLVRVWWDKQNQGVAIATLCVAR
jgi:cadmium resistance protein CadD (predicted permease)